MLHRATSLRLGPRRVLRVRRRDVRQRHQLHLLVRRPVPDPKVPANHTSGVREKLNRLLASCRIGNERVHVARPRKLALVLEAPMTRPTSRAIGVPDRRPSR
jgi:hypothetical protein